MAKPKSKNTAFGTEVSELLTSKSMTMNGLAATAATLDNGQKLSTSYIGDMMSGRKPPKKQWVDLIADVLKATPEQRVTMYRAAAQDIVRRKGFDIDLTKKE